MPTLYFQISGFVFTDSSLANANFSYHILNYNKQVVKGVDFNFSDATQILQSYHINLEKLADSNLMIELFKKTEIDEELIGTINIPIIILPKNVVTINTLPLIMSNNNDAQIGIKISLHLTEFQKPYRAPIKEPVLIQMKNKHAAFPRRSITLSKPIETNGNETGNIGRIRRNNILLNSI